MATRKATKIAASVFVGVIVCGVLAIAIREAIVNKQAVKIYEETAILRKKTDEMNARAENAKILMEKFSTSLSRRQASVSALLVTQRYFLDSPSEQALLNLESNYNELIRVYDELIQIVDEINKIVMTEAGLSDEKERLEILKGLPSIANMAVDFKSKREKVIELKNRIKSKVVKIVADEIWQGSGLNAVKDDVVICTAKGQWRWGVSLGGWVDGRGEAGSAGYRLVSAFGNGALLCAIKGSDKLNAALSHFSADRSGEVVLQINDTLVGDNRGHLDVTVFTFPWFDGKY